MVWCTPTRAKKTVVGLAVIAVIVGSVDASSGLYVADIKIIHRIYSIVFPVLVPVSVLVINALVVREVRRRASTDAVNHLRVFFFLFLFLFLLLLPFLFPFPL